MNYVSEYDMLGLMTIKNKPQVVMMSFQKEYGRLDENSNMRICKHCRKAFVATRPNVEFCLPQCKNQYNVYKNSAQKNDTLT